MDGFQREYNRTNAANHNVKYVDYARRALITGMRSKIKSVEHRPNLLVMQQHMRLRGGDFHYPTEDLFYTPQSSAFESGAMSSGNAGEVTSSLAGQPHEVASVDYQMFGGGDPLPPLNSVKDLAAAMKAAEALRARKIQESIAAEPKQKFVAKGRGKHRKRGGVGPLTPEQKLRAQKVAQMRTQMNVQADESPDFSDCNVCRNLGNHKGECLQCY